MSDQESPFEKHLDEAGGSVTISQIYERIDDMESVQRMTKGEIRKDWTRGMVLKELGFKEGIIPDIRCFAEVAQGTEPKVALSYQNGQEEVVRTLLAPELLTSNFILDKLYAKVHVVTLEGEVKERETRVKATSIMPSHRDNVVISQGLASELGIENGGEIYLDSIFQKVSDVNLDDI